MQGQIISSTDFDALVNEHDLIFVDFSADWCSPCKQFSLAYEQVSRLYPDVVFAKVNIEEQQELANLFEIRSVPHLLVIKKGIAIYSDAGSISAATLTELAEQALSIDLGDMIQ